MNEKTLMLGSLRPARIIGLSLLPLGVLLATALSTPVQALTLTLKDQTTNATITPDYKYIINVDNTGTTEQRSPDGGCSPTNANYPGNVNGTTAADKPCNWVSIAGAASSAPIFTQGDQSNIGAVSLPTGRYLISVLADGYKLDGEHVVGTESTSQAVTVKMHSGDLPPATIQSAVFEDISPTNGAPDMPAEHGLAGFQGHIFDYIAEVTTDVAGNPLCAKYDTSGNYVAGSGGICLSKCYVVDNGLDIGTVAPVDAAGRCPSIPTTLNPGDPTGLSMIEGGTVPATAVIEGKLKIPNLGPNRYALSITQPNGFNWQQTTTLEGNLDWDAWVMEGATGLDTEFVVAGEPFPAVIFGYVQKNTPALGGDGTIKGVIDAVKVYVPTNGGLALPGTIWGGLAGGKIDKPVDKPWLSLTGLNVGDTAVWVGQGNTDGSFNIPSVPAGNYTLTWWDSNLNYILDLVQISVNPGETVDMGVLPLNGWWTRLEGYVYNDINENGIKDPGEVGLANYPVVLRKRENSLMDRGAVAVTTDANGYYVMENAYPMTQWLVEEAYDDLHYTTGVTYQADNQPNPTTLKGEGVDVSVLPIIGLSGRLDWGKHSYKSGTNGGIVGTVSYGTTRNELNPQYSVVEDWQPGMSNIPVHLYAPVPCGTTTTSVAPCDASGRYELETAGGAFKKGALLNTYVTETWQRPSDCVARGVDGTKITTERVLPTDTSKECLEGPLMGVQFGPMPDDPLAPTNFGAAVDGNYGFAEGCFNGTLDATDPANPLCTGGAFTSLTPADYLVEVVVPNDSLNRPIYKFTREEDINIGNGDNFVPQIPPPECAGPLHTVDVATVGTDGYGVQTLDDPSGNPLGGKITVPASTATVNSTFPGLDLTPPVGSPSEGQAKPLCNMKLVRVSNGKSIAPTFEVFTDVPLPGRFWGLIVDDLNFSSDPKALNFGEKAGVPFAPVGIYDYTDRLITTVESDFNGLFDVLLPSTNRISCPTPSGVCANLYRMVGNDPGVPGHLNLNYHPEFRTISAEFEAFPGLIVPADLAPSQVGVSVQIPGGQVAQPLSCPLNVAGTAAAKLVPELYAVSVPYVNSTGSVVIQGNNFGATRGTGNVYLDNTAIGTSAAWGNNAITVTVPSSIPAGPHQLTIVAGNGQKTVNGLTFHVLGGVGTTAYNPTVLEVGPGKTYAPVESLPLVADHAIQRALDAAPSGALVVVYPNINTPATPRQNPRGAYYENLIISKSVKLQGVGPGSPDGSVRGTIIDGGAFAGDSPVATDWYTTISTRTWDGNQTIYDGAIISIYTASNAFPTASNTNTAPSIDGFDLRGGNQQGFPTNINVIGGGATGLPPNAVTQGGAIFANAYAHNLRITNNVVQNNGGAYGTIRIGTPNLPAPDTNQHNDNVRIANNRIIANGGTNLAGAIGLFAGSSNYEVASNDICGNFSAEYGGGITSYGLNYNGASAYNVNTNFGGKIHHNRIYLNRSYDEGAGIMIAGELPANPALLSPGAGPVAIFSNLIQGNLSNDDGGGIRFLQAASDCNTTAAYTACNSDVLNNMIVNNVSAHEGGGISLNDAPNVRVYNNTIMKNITTATAATSTGSPAPAGLSTSLHSSQLNTALGIVAGYSNPVLFNNIFWDNRAGARSGSTVTGIGATGDATAINPWDLGSTDIGALLAPINSFVQQTSGYTDAASNRHVDPAVVTPYDTVLDFAAWRTNPAFIGAIMVTLDVPPTLSGDYHLLTGSPAINLGVAGPISGVSAPTLDIDDGTRTGLPDVGADEQGVAGLGLGSGTGGGGTGPILPTLAVLDNFNRANANTLNNGTNWNQVTIATTAPLTFIGNALCNAAGFGTTAPCAAVHITGPAASGIANAVANGNAYWSSNFNANQAAAFTFANTPLNNTALMLKATGANSGLSGLQANFIRVQYQTTGGGRIVVSTTNNGNNLAPTYTTSATFTTNANFANGNTLSAVIRANGTVEVFKTSSSTISLGSVQLPNVALWTTGGGRIGMQLPSSARVDNFAGGTVP